MRKHFVFTVLFILSFLTGGLKAQIKSPDAFFGYKIGSDYTLAPWDSIVLYFNYLSDNTNRVNINTLGKTTLGNDLIFLEITAEENIARLNQFKQFQKMLADPRLINSREEEREIVKNSKPVVLINCQIHSTEAAASQMALELAYELATTNEPEKIEILKNVIILLIPSANPDGQALVVDYYRKTIGTPWEGGRLPFLYHKYAGHDNNRDWFMLNLKETRLISKLLYSNWFPTVVWDVHQTRKNSYRLFLPPFHDPKNPNMHPIMERMLYVLGGQMAMELSARGMKGVIHGVTYDNYWAGGFRTTPQRHNMVGLLSEAASVNIASPVFFKYNELKGVSRGMPEYAMQVNFPDPWPGGWWRLRDIIDYEKVAAFGLLRYVSRFHDELQENYLRMGRDAIQQGKSEPPFAWLIPPNQDKGRILQLLKRLFWTGIEIHEALAPFKAGNRLWPKGSYVLYAAQPYRPHLKDMMEVQKYPNRRKYPGGPAEAPYDMAGWTLPMLIGVDYAQMSEPFDCQVKKLNDLPQIKSKIEGSGKYLIVPTQFHDSYKFINRVLNSGKNRVYRYAGQDLAVKNSRILHRGDFVVESTVKNLGQMINGLSFQAFKVNSFSDVVINSLKPIKKPRIAIYQPWTASMDEGWTRYVLDEFEFQYAVFHNDDIKAGNLLQAIDILILPSISENAILKGNAPNTTFPQYVGGLEESGVRAIQNFVSRGGKLLAIDRSSNFVINQLKLPVKNVLKKVKREEFYCPGSILRVITDDQHPLAFGLNKWNPAYFTNSQAFQIDDSLFNAQEKLNIKIGKIDIVGFYAPTSLLMSGWLLGESKISGKPALLEIHYDQGIIDLFGFRIQHRAQPRVTFPFLFNAILR